MSDIGMRLGDKRRKTELSPLMSCSWNFFIDANNGTKPPSLFSGTFDLRTLHIFGGLRGKKMQLRLTCSASRNEWTETTGLQPGGTFFAGRKFNELLTARK